MAFISALKMRTAAGALKTQALRTAALIEEIEKAYDVALADNEAADARERIRHARVPCGPPLPNLGLNRRHRQDWDMLEALALKLTIGRRQLESLTGALDGIRRMYTDAVFAGLPRQPGDVKFIPVDRPALAATQAEIEEANRRCREWPRRVSAISIATVTSLLRGKVDANLPNFVGSANERLWSVLAGVETPNRSLVHFDNRRAGRSSAYNIRVLPREGHNTIAG